MCTGTVHVQLVVNILWEGLTATSFSVKMSTKMVKAKTEKGNYGRHSKIKIIFSCNNYYTLTCMKAFSDIQVVNNFFHLKITEYEVLIKIL